MEALGGNPVIVGSVSLSRADLQRANDELTRAGGRAVVIIGLLGLVLVLAAGISEGRAQTQWLTFALPLIFMAVMPHYFRYQQRRAVVRLLESKFPAEIETRFELGESGYVSRNTTSTIDVPWSSVLSQRETSSAFVLASLNPTTRLVLPKRAFPDSALPAIRELLRAHVRTVSMPNARRRVLIAWALIFIACIGIWAIFKFGDDGDSPPRVHHRAGE